MGQTLFVQCEAELVAAALLLWSVPVLADGPPAAPASTTPPALLASSAPRPVPLPTAAPAAPLRSTIEFNAPMTVGLTMFSLSYGVCFLSVPLIEDERLFPMWIPIAGPWISAELLKPEEWGRVYLGVLSGLQVVGAGVFAFGALLPRDPAPRPDERPRKAAFHLAPVVGPGGWGLSAQGAF